MPMPYTYRHASAEFRAYLDAARAAMNLESDNATYTATEAVLLCFRRRLTLDQSLRFADILPAVLRAIFVAHWHPVLPAPWGSRADQIAECKALRPQHNLTPDTCIDAVAEALTTQILAVDLDPVLAAIGPGAQTFWHVPLEKRHSVAFG
jgi:uncharacterized protein (DUF2267 family)